MYKLYFYFFLHIFFFFPLFLTLYFKFFARFDQNATQVALELQQQVIEEQEMVTILRVRPFSSLF